MPAPPMHFESWLQLFLTASAAIASAWAGWRYVWPSLVRLTKRTAGLGAGILALADLPQLISEAQTRDSHRHAQDQILARIVKEVIPNGGSSLRDAVSRIEVGVSQQGEHLRILSGTMRANLDSDPHRAMFETDGDGVNLWVNKTYLRWCNRSVAEMMGWGWLSAVRFEDRARVRAEWEQAVRERRQFHTHYFLQPTDDHAFEVEVSATPIPEGGERVERYVGVIRRIERDLA